MAIVEQRGCKHIVQIDDYRRWFLAAELQHQVIDGARKYMGYPGREPLGNRMGLIHRTCLNGKIEVFSWVEGSPFIVDQSNRPAKAPQAIRHFEFPRPKLGSDEQRRVSVGAKQVGTNGNIRRGHGKTSRQCLTVW